MAKDLANRRLKIWHRLRHEDFDVFEQPLLASESAQDWITATIERGGFWCTQINFVPWHSVSFIELQYD